jgi:hypothetical protein
MILINQKLNKGCTFMNNKPRKILQKLVADYGCDFLTDSPFVCKNLLYDFCGNYYCEILVIIELLNAGTVKHLRQYIHVLPYEAIRYLLIEKLEQEIPFKKDALKWGIDTWSISLGIYKNSFCCNEEINFQKQPSKVTNQLQIDFAEPQNIFEDFIFNFRQLIIPILMTAIQKYLYSFNLHYKSFTKF